MTYNVLSGTLNITQSKSINFSLITPPLSFRPCLREATHLKTGKMSWRNRRIDTLKGQSECNPCIPDRLWCILANRTLLLATIILARAMKLPNLMHCVGIGSHSGGARSQSGDTVDPGQFNAMGRQRLQDARASLSPDGWQRSKPWFHVKITLLKNFIPEPPASVAYPIFLNFSTWFHHKMK